MQCFDIQLSSHKKSKERKNGWRRKTIRQISKTRRYYL